MTRPPPDAITGTNYGALEQAYHYLSDTVFGEVLGHPLPPCLITWQRHHGAYGYFSPERFAQRSDSPRTTHEIALNPDLFPGRSDQEILSTLAHEGVHAYQHHYGKPGRRRYHNAEWSRWMERLGLMPSATGAPGGKKTGERMSHYILPGGPFEHAIETLLETGFALRWQAAIPPVLRGMGSGTGARGSLPSKRRFSCPGCRQNAWAKPTAALVCGLCKIPMYASIL